MFRFSDFHFDRLSFWLGFLAATLFWWLVSRTRPFIPVWREQFRRYLESLRLRDLAGMDGYIRRETICRAQRMHLAAPLFSLDEILVEPRLMAPPLLSAMRDPAASQSMAAQVIPYLPDWPELVAPFGGSTLSLAEALQNGVHVAIIGQPGCGKTVALAHLASQMGRQVESLGNLTGAIPLLLHALDLDPSLSENQDPFQNVIKAITAYASVVMQPQIPRFLQAMERDPQRRMVLLLDGLDELPNENLNGQFGFLTALIQKHSNIQVVVTASSDYLDGLTHAGFFPLGVAAWKPAQREAFAARWGELWTRELLPEVKKQAPEEGGEIEIDPRLVNTWLSTDGAYASPLELTLRAWGAYTGDLSGSSLMSLLDAHIARFLPTASLMPAMEVLAHQMLLRPTSSLSYGEMEKILSAFKPATSPIEMAVGDSMAVINSIAVNTSPAVPNSPTVTGEDGVQMEPSAAAGAENQIVDSTAKPEQRKKKGRRELTVQSRGEQIMNALVDAGILVEQPNQQVRFASPLFAGYLAGIHLSAQEAAEMAQKTGWSSTRVPALCFAAICAEDPEWIYELLKDSPAPLCQNLLVVSRWLREAPANAPWRSSVLRELVGLLHNEALPLGTRARMIGAVYLSRDPATMKLYKQLLLSKSPVVRRIALLGMGALGNPQGIDDILRMLADPDPSVRVTACLAVAAVPGDTALKAVVEILLQADEQLRRAAAEALAQSEGDGHKILQEAAAIDDLLARHAAVFGLLQVRQPWARKCLEKIAVEDGQWVVRNAAAQALDSLQAANTSIPQPLQPAGSTAWLLTFASKLGKGLSPDQPATEVLLLALKSGTVDEQLAALEYLREIPEEGVVGAVYNLLYSGQEELQEPALHALWWMTLSGASLPAPAQFGLG